MEIREFIDEVQKLGIQHFVGVPDSTLKLLCEYLNGELKKQIHHYVPANEGAAVGMAAGIYLATGIPACVYLQNSGIGNMYNPVVSLLHEEVYDIPMFFIVGWRGEPGTKDEPQHRYQGKVTEETLRLIGIKTYTIGKETDKSNFLQIMEQVKKRLKNKERVALIIKKDTFVGQSCYVPENPYQLLREEAINCILDNIDQTAAIISTTGKISRELYEAEQRLRGESRSFLTVGSMGHASMIALGIAMEKPERKIYCLDGDGAAFMHLGAIPFIGNCKPDNYVHILLNNNAHESVGGMPTGIAGMDYSRIADICGYEHVYLVSDLKELNKILTEVRERKGTVFIEVKVAVGAREDLGRPKESPVENKKKFMEHLLTENRQ